MRRWALVAALVVFAAPAAAANPLRDLIPKPLEVRLGHGSVALGDVVAGPGTAGLAKYAASVLGLHVGTTPGVLLSLGGDSSLGSEGYALSVTRARVGITAPRPAGIFYGIQTLRQLVSAGRVPIGEVRDRPRYAWRGAMLDVARHFFGVRDVERFVDLMAAYKLNRLHLHLTDDQGWRIAIAGWPRLTSHGGSTAVGGGRGGWYTQADYRRIVAYAQARFVTVVPEIDMPGHVGSALSSYGGLSCDGVAPPLETRLSPAFSSLCTTKASTYAFVADVLRQVAALTPGPWLHIGGDEAQATKGADYARFVERVQAIVSGLGKHLVGWEEVAKTKLAPGSVVQHWHDNSLLSAARRQGAGVIQSPADKAYMDMKYDASTKLGLSWAGYTSVRDAYEWDPGQALGVEAPLWSETLRTFADVEYMAFPRLLGYAELAWSPATGRSWREYRLRLAAQGPRLAALGVNFYRSPEVPWP